MSARAPERRSAPGDRRRFLIAVVGLGLFLALLEVGGQRTRELTAPADRLTARLTADLLTISGMPVERDGAVVSLPGGFSIEIYYWCSDWLVVFAMWVGLFALPGRAAGKLSFALAGGAALGLLNQIRLVHLFSTGVRAPATFDLLHHAFWEPVMLLSVLGLWAWWLRISRRRFPEEGGGPTVDKESPT